MTRVLTTIDEHPRLISGVLLGVGSSSSPPVYSTTCSRSVTGCSDATTDFT